MNRVLFMATFLTIATSATAAPAEISLTGDAEADWIAISGTGNSKAFYAVSGTGTSNGTIPLSITGNCTSYWEYEDFETGERHTAGQTNRCLAANADSDADGHWIGLSGTGNASGVIAISGGGNSSGIDSCLGAWAFIGSWSCSRNASITSVSALGEASEGSFSVSTMGDASARFIAISAMSDAAQSGPSIIGLAISGTGSASACTHSPGCIAVAGCAAIPLWDRCDVSLIP